MAFDIYGGTLRAGFCEVHPHVGESYPCSLCMQQSSDRQREQREYDQAMAAEAEAYYREEYEHHLRAIGYDPIALGC